MHNCKPAGWIKTYAVLNEFHCLIICRYSNGYTVKMGAYHPMFQSTNGALPKESTIASLSDADWAWEFLRRNPDYKRDYRLSRARLNRVTKFNSKTQFVRIFRQCPYARNWGLQYMPNPSLSSQKTLIAWLPEAVGWSTNAEAYVGISRHATTDLNLKLAKFDRALVVITPTTQNLFIRVGPHPACLQIVGDSILIQPVKMRFIIEGVGSIRSSITALETMHAVVSGKKLNHRSIPNLTSSRRLRYLIAAETAFDGALLRDIGAAIYGKKRAAEEWKNLDSRAFKDQIIRAKRQGISLAHSGYRKFLH